MKRTFIDLTGLLEVIAVAVSGPISVSVMGCEAWGGEWPIGAQYPPGKRPATARRDGGDSPMLSACEHPGPAVQKTRNRSIMP